MREISFIDTTLRDGNNSLWALNMRTGAMAPIAPEMDQAGFESMEFFLTEMWFKKCVREFKEDPWEWFREGTKGFLKTRLRSHGGSKGSFEKIPRSIAKLTTELLVSYGLTLTRTGNYWNDFKNFRQDIEDMKKLGMDAVLNVIYSVSPRHTDEYFAQKTREAAACRPWRICFKDVGGLLTPERVRTLIPLVLKNAGDIPVELHGHCTTGQAPLCYLEAVKLGITILHTAVPPLANGTSQPSIFNVAHNLRLMGYTPLVDLKPLAAVEKHFTMVARQDGLPMGRPLEYDHSQYLHQIAGGMIANMRHQLKLVGMEHKMEEAKEEFIQVRKDFGFPIIVTPLAQFVGTQAAINVIAGERYKVVPDQVIQYALGYWGKDAPEVMDQNIKDLILSRPRAKEWTEWEPPEPTLAEIRKKFGANVSDEELILRYFSGNDAIDELQKGGFRPRTYLDAAEPVVKIIETFSKEKETNHVFIKRPGFSVRMERRTIGKRGTGLN